jgi:tetratricopeptide (TPR) repeat protein
MILHRFTGSASSPPGRTSSKKPHGYSGGRPRRTRGLPRRGRCWAWSLLAKSYKVALAINPHSTQTHTKLGDALQILGRPSEAISHYECALAGGNESAAAHSNLGNALQLLGCLDAAQRHYERALALDPGRPEPHSNLAVLLAAQNHVDVAIAHYQAALALKPDYYKALNKFGQCSPIGRTRRGGDPSVRVGGFTASRSRRSA